MSGARRTDRPGLTQALAMARAGDTLVVWRPERSGCSLRHCIEAVTEREQREIGFTSLTKAIETTSSGGKLVFHIVGAPAEFERNLIREHRRAGLLACRVRGCIGDR